MHQNTNGPAAWRVLGATLFAVACGDHTGPDLVHAPLLAVALDQQNGTMGLAGGATVLAKGFNPTNPRRGAAVVATFLWSGPPGIITAVNDRLANGRPVGNSYHLVETASAGGLSMATYVATNVQGFPDPCCSVENNGQDSVYVVQAFLSQGIPEGGVIISAYTGVDTAFATAVGAHRSGSGSASTTTVATPGAIPTDSGSLVYGVAIATPVVGHSSPGPPFNLIGSGSSPSIASDAQWGQAVTTGSVNPQWTWFFSEGAPGSWLASGVVLRAAGAAPPPATGSLAVTTSTTGSTLDPDGYAVAVEGGTPQAIGINATVTFPGLSAGDHSVALSGMASNCTVSGANPRTVTVPSGGTGGTTFTVTCSDAGAVRISGAGSVGTAPPVPGNDVRDFDLDVSANLTGSRLVFRDWFVVRPDGSVGKLTVAPTDGATRVTVFRDGSPTCADPTRGVEFEGIGRLNSGGDSNPGGDELLPFIVHACDGGPAGSGADYFRIVVPGHGYDRGDAVTAGDLVKSGSGSPATGSLAATTSTTGSTLDPDGYAVAVDGGTPQAIGINATVTFPGLAAGDHSVALSGVASNCTVSSNPRTISVPSGGTASTTFSVTCTTAPAREIVLVESNGTLGQSGTELGKEFNPRNPPLGSTIVATFVWQGSTNVITNVTDYLWTGFVVGNTYTLVEYVTRGGISMATYVATNVQNFPYPKPDFGQELIVRAHLSSAVPAGGAVISAYAGVHPDLAQALGEHRSAAGTDAIGVARPGAISHNPGALVYGTSMITDGLVGMDPPAGFTKIGTGSDYWTQIDAEYAIPATAGSADPRWAWTFNSSDSWLASVLTLNPAPQ